MPQFTSLDRPPEYYEEIARARNPRHDIHCMNTCCFKTPVCCMVCKFEFRHVNGLVRHRVQSHGEKKGSSHAVIRQRLRRRELIPDGLGYLTKVFASPERKAINIEELSKFAQHIDALQHTKPRRRLRSILNAGKLQALKEDPNDSTHVNLNVPNKYMIPVYQIWEVSGVQPRHILLALVAYGLEHLATELKKYPVAPEVKDKTLKTFTEPPKKEVKDAIPKTPPTSAAKFL